MVRSASSRVSNHEAPLALRKIVHLKDAEAENRHFDAGIESDFLHGFRLLSFCFIHDSSPCLSVDAVLVKINTIRLETLERRIGNLPDALRAAVRSARCVPAFEPKLRADHDLIAVRRERFADPFFIGKRTVRLGGVEEGDAALDRRPDQFTVPAPLTMWPAIRQCRVAAMT